MIRIAACRCRACVIEVEGEPVINQLCHCGDCRRRTGSALGWSSVFAESQVRERRGAFHLYVSEGTSGRTANSFCAVCGVSLFGAPDALPGYVWIPGGCFTDPPLPEPSASNSDDQRCAWLTLPDGWRRRTTAMAEASRSSSPG